VAYVSGADPANYQPANITFDLLPKIEYTIKDKKLRHAEICKRALAAIEKFRSERAEAVHEH
jgi:methylenetetrahydrofolate--tRNA-(uracil-5-)-methyltransferase